MSQNLKWVPQKQAGWVRPGEVGFGLKSVGLLKRTKLCRGVQPESGWRQISGRTPAQMGSAASAHAMSRLDGERLPGLGFFCTSSICMDFCCLSGVCHKNFRREGLMDGEVRFDNHRNNNTIDATISILLVIRSTPAMLSDSLAIAPLPHK